VPVGPDNVVLTGLAARALAAEFIGWQCRLRQLAVREDGGRPSPGMRPRVTTLAGQELASGVATLITEREPENTTERLRYTYLQTHDPSERYERVIQFLQAGYFQEPQRFAEVLTALFGPDSEVAEQLAELRQCVLEFEQYRQGYRLPCKVTHLEAAHPRYQATLWHNRLFNPGLPPTVTVLAFMPDWRHASGWRRAGDDAVAQ